MSNSLCELNISAVAMELGFEDGVLVSRYLVFVNGFLVSSSLGVVFGR